MSCNKAISNRKISWRFRQFEDLSIEELYALLALRVSVFVVEQNCAYNETDGKDRHACHVLGYNDKALVAYLRILPPDPASQYAIIGRVAVEKPARGNGIGEEAVREALGFIAETWGPVSIKISAQKYLVRFYKELGFIPHGLPYEEDRIPHIEMRYPAAQ